MDQTDRFVVTLPQLMDRQVRHHPDSVALNVDGEQTLTYAEWDRSADAVARGLLERGIRPGQSIGLLAAPTDWIQYAIGYLAAKKVGAATFHLSSLTPPAEVSRRLALCEAVGVLHTSSVESVVEHPGWTVSVPALQSTPGSGPVYVEPDPDGMAEIIFTSGTTGTAKAIAVTQRMLTWGMDLEDEVAEIEGQAETALYSNPIGSSPGMILVMTPMVAHPPIAVAVTRHDPDFLAGLIEKLRVQAIYVSPAIAIAMANANIHERHDLSSVTEFTNASASMAKPVARKLARMFPNAKMNRAYVSLESVPAFTRVTVPAYADDPEYFDRPDSASVGVPKFGSQVSVRDQNHQPVPARTIGEIWMTTPAPMRRYYRDDVANARTYVDGWVRMNDLGHLDDDGRLYIFDRMADAIAGPDGPISTLAVEEVLYEHPAVAEAAVFAVPDPSNGHQVAAAAVIVKEPVSPVLLRDFAAARLAPQHAPVVVHIVDELPRGTLGKVLKRELRHRFPAFSVNGAPSSNGSSGGARNGWLRRLGRLFRR